MSKKILSIVLFAAMMLSMISVANANEVPKPTGLAYVSVSTTSVADAQNVTIAPPGSLVGIMVPGVYDDDEIFITGQFENIISREFNVAIVLNGLLDTRDNNHDKVWINDGWVDLTDESVHAVTADGLNSIIYTTFRLSYNHFMDDQSSSRSYFVRVVKEMPNLEVDDFDFEFEIFYIDDSFVGGTNVGIDMYDFSTALGDVGIYVDPFYAPIASDDDSIYEYGNAIVDVNTRLNVRAGAGTSFPVLTQLTGGTYVHVLYVDGNWAALADDNGDIAGYVHTRYLIIL